jgi:SAM-dependent methyltransferase
MQKKYDYTLKVGEDGSKRLLLLNELFNPYSLEFIEATTQLRNKRVLDVGCGTGIMSGEMAARCLPDGRVLAADISSEQLELARIRAERFNSTNIDYLQISAFDIDQITEKFDVIYFRFVLAHLPNALEIIQKAVTLMHANSILICEEPEDVDKVFCDPPDDTFAWWRKGLDVQVQACKGNFTIGSELSRLFKECKLEVVNEKTIQPLMTTSRLKQQLWMGLEECTPIVISSGFATQEEIDSMVLRLKIFAEKPSTTVGLFSVKQIAAII